MEVIFLGGTSFKFKTKTITLIVDPISNKEKADVLVYSGVGKVVKEISGAVNREKTFVIDMEGEYELGGMGIMLDRLEAGINGFMIRITGDGVEVAHVGAVEGTLDEKLKTKLTDSEVMLVSLKKAVELIGDCEPYMAVLMGYDNVGEVDQFLDSHKFEVVKRDVDKLKLDADSLPENTEVIVLNG